MEAKHLVGQFINLNRADIFVKPSLLTGTAPSSFLRFRGLDQFVCVALKRGMGLNIMESGARLPGFKSWLPHLESICPRVAYLISQCYHLQNENNN